MTDEISNYDDVIDSRDIIERIAELENEREDLNNAVADSDAETVEANRAALAEWNEDNNAELVALIALQEEAQGYSEDWKYGASLVRDSYWVEYVQQLLEDIGEMPKNLPSYIEIDWEATARNIQVDSTSVDFDGITYWVR